MSGLFSFAEPYIGLDKEASKFISLYASPPPPRIFQFGDATNPDTELVINLLFAKAPEADFAPPFRTYPLLPPVIFGSI